MKFLLEFVRCCSSAVSGDDVAPESNSDTKALMLTSKRRRCKRKKRGPNSNSSSEWKPSLTAITEDKAAVVLEERIVKRRSHVYAADSRTRRSFEDRRDHFTTIPTFSATPFMF